MTGPRGLLHDFLSLHFLAHILFLARPSACDMRTNVLSRLLAPLTLTKNFSGLGMPVGGRQR